MKQFSLTTLMATAATALTATQAAAHPGHMADLAGHDHWIAGVAVGAAVLVGLWGILRDRRPKADKVNDHSDGGTQSDGAPADEEEVAA